MSERALKVVKTSSGATVAIVEYITGGEGRVLGLMSGEDKSLEEKEKLQDKMIEICVKSVNDSTDDVVQMVKDMRISDYLEVVQECTKLFEGLDEQKKTQ